MPEPLSSPDTWVDLYGDMLYGYALKMLSNTTLAHDLVQETFLAALKSRKSFKKQSHEKTWFFGILKHKILDHLRHKYREMQGAENAGTEEAVEAFFDHASGMLKKMPASWQVNPSELIEKEEFWSTLHSCLDHLPEKTRDAFKLRELEEEKTEDICKVLDITATNLWVILHRARVLMRSCLEKNWFKAGT
jgi:RNA polymerase sigma-70 factor (ECF subfamily)